MKQQEVIAIGSVSFELNFTVSMLNPNNDYVKGILLSSQELGKIDSSLISHHLVNLSIQFEIKTEQSVSIQLLRYFTYGVFSKHH